MRTGLARQDRPRPVLVRRTIMRRPIAAVRRPVRPSLPPQRRGLLCRRIVAGRGGCGSPSGTVPPQIAAAFRNILAARAMRPGPARPLGPRAPMMVNKRPMQG